MKRTFPACAAAITTAIAIILCSCAANRSMARTEGRSTGPADPSGFVVLTDVVPDVILEIRYYSTFNFVGTRVDGYEEPIALMTREAAAALKAVSDEMIERGYRLKIWDTYRPQMAVDHFCRWGENVTDTLTKRWFYPYLEKDVVFDQGYIARRSGHSRGSVVDLTLVDMKTGRDIDMGYGFDWFGAESHPDWTKGLTEEQISNRMLLRDVMLRHGFLPITEEWWHFVLKDEPYPDTYFTFPVRRL
ncbi:MAG: M15 family metallopeptidase [Bacteroidales bacterium]|nr:M15 family metallopeptidase [Bacteroidales bacterium]